MQALSFGELQNSFWLQETNVLIRGQSHYLTIKGDVPEHAPVKMWEDLEINFLLMAVAYGNFQNWHLRCSFNIEAPLRFWSPYTIHIIEGDIYWSIFTETVERQTKVPSLPMPQAPALTCGALENTTILKESFFTLDYWFHLIFILSLMIDTVNFCCSLCILDIVIYTINHMHNCHKNRNAFS